MIEIRAESPDAPASQALFDDYLALVRERLGAGFTPSEDIFATEGAFQGAGTAWLVLYDDGVPVGRGHGRRLLVELEALAQAAGYERILLLTTEVLAEARGLYRSAGYEILSTERCGGRVDFWLQKRIAG